MLRSRSADTPRRRWPLFALLAVLALFGDAFAQSRNSAPPRKPRVGVLPPGFSEQIVVTGLDGATAMTIAPDGRIFVCEQIGRLRVVADGELLERPFVTLEVDDYWERGLIGVALDPKFESNGFVYLVHVAKDPYPHHRVSRFTADGNVAVPGSEKVLLRGDDQRKLGGSVKAGHQGGGIHFGNDGRIYVGIGEQTAGRPSQSLDTFQGKLLRIAPDGSIPRDNPFFGEAEGKYRAIWARGLRNPYAFAVERSTGRIFINDVGGNRWEEINEGAAGANYGWPLREGWTADPDLTSPVHAYGESGGQCISGGDFYEPARQQFPPQYHGKYFFADFTHSWIQVLDPERPRRATEFARDLARPVDLRVAPDGSLYYLNRNMWVRNDKFQHGTSSLHRIVYAPNADVPVPRVSSPDVGDLVALEGGEVRFAVTASGKEPLRYRWQRDGEDLPGARGPRLELAGLRRGDTGSEISCVVTNEHGTTRSAVRRLRVVERRAGVDVAESEPGLRRWTFAEGVESLLALVERDRRGEAVVTASDPQRQLDVKTTSVLAGYLLVEEDAVHHFSVLTDAACKLIVSGHEILRLPPSPSPRQARGAIGLSAGHHAFLLAVAPREAGSSVVVRHRAGEGTWRSLDRVPLVRSRQVLSADELLRDFSPVVVPRNLDAFPQRLSRTGLFASMGKLIPSPGVQPYAVNSPQWVDGARLARYIAVPQGGKIRFSERGAWQLPDGTVLVQHVAIPTEKGSLRRLETRVLVADAFGGGTGATYRWREGSSDAELVRSATTEDLTEIVSFKTGLSDWSYLAPGDCASCHHAGTGFALGVNTRQLNGPGPAGSSFSNQILAWRARGLLANPPGEDALERLPRLASLDDEEASLEQRVYSYLDTNCSACHRPGGVRASFDARYHTPPEKKGFINGKIISADLGVDGIRIVKPGAPEASMIYFRMARRRDVFNMPPLGSSVADRQALNVVQRWIESLGQRERSE